MHDINLIDHAVTFACGLACGAVAMLITAMCAKMFSQRRENVKQAYDRTVALVELNMLAKIRECLVAWTRTGVDRGVGSSAVAKTNDLVRWIDEQFLNQ